MRERTKLGRVEKGIRQGAKAAGMTEQDFMAAVCDVYRSKQSGIEVWMKENGVEGLGQQSVLPGEPRGCLPESDPGYGKDDRKPRRAGSLPVE